MTQRAQLAAILRQIAADEDIEPSRLFIERDIVFRRTGDSVTGVACQIGTEYWEAAALAVELLKRVSK